MTKEEVVERIETLGGCVDTLRQNEIYRDGALARVNARLAALFDYLGLSWRHIDGTPAHYEIVKKDKVNLSFLSYRR